jgi:hypothetical protein
VYPPATTALGAPDLAVDDLGALFRLQTVLRKHQELLLHASQTDQQAVVVPAKLIVEPLGNKFLQYFFEVIHGQEGLRLRPRYNLAAPIAPER